MRSKFVWGDVACLTWMIATSVSAETADQLLSSPRVRRYLAVGTAGERLVLCADAIPGNTVSAATVGDCRTAGETPMRYVASAGKEILVVWPAFNPLQMDAAGVLTSSPDAAAAQLSTIADLVSALGGNLAKQDFSRALDLTDPGWRGRGDDDFLKKVLAYQALLQATVVTADDVSNWAASATGLSGIKRVRAQMSVASAELATHFTDVANALAAVESAATSADQKAIASTLRIAAVSDPLRDQRILKQAIDGLHESLASYDKRRWDAADALVLDTVTITPEEEFTYTLTARTIVLRLKDQKLEREVGKPSKVELRFRAHRRFVPESAVGLIHTGLRRPVYKSVAEDGRLVVGRGEDQAVDLAAAAVMNLVCRCGGTPGFNFMFQLGVSSGADVPAFLVGGGIRLKGKAPVSISGGLVLSWLKDLDKLNPGDLVASDLDIEADLKRQLEHSWYIGLQYKF